MWQSGFHEAVHGYIWLHEGRPCCSINFEHILELADVDGSLFERWTRAICRPMRYTERFFASEVLFDSGRYLRDHALMALHDTFNIYVRTRTTDTR